MEGSSHGLIWGSIPALSRGTKEKQTKRTLSQDSQFLDQDLELGLHKYGAKVVPILLWYSAN
jgi:hypothetical protein